MMLLMKPSYAEMNKSFVGRPQKEYGKYPKKKKVAKKANGNSGKVAKNRNGYSGKVAKNGNGKSW
jgi:hypothetical protein